MFFMFAKRCVPSFKPQPAGFLLVVISALKFNLNLKQPRLHFASLPIEILD
jgi:hypothetical protein